ncbi:MAG: hypothetical protein ABSA83_02560 [Verrucomicrobiota bacterium]|jgi:hypothetical protein
MDLLTDMANSFNFYYTTAGSDIETQNPVPPGNIWPIHRHVQARPVENPAKTRRPRGSGISNPSSLANFCCQPPGKGLHRFHRMTGRTTFHLSILALSAVASPMAANCQQQEPVSGGKPLSYWMDRLDNRSDTAARAAIKEMGTNALPDLMRVLRQPQPVADESRGRALDALACLGPVGKPALPDILPLVTSQNRHLKIRAFFALKAIGPETELVKPILPTLLQALEDQEAATNAPAAITGQPLAHSTLAENAGITYNFPGVPLQQVLNIYENLAGKTVSMAATPAGSQMIRLRTAQPLTKTEALQLLEEVLQQQAGLVIVRGKDGSFTAIAKPQDRGGLGK